MNRWGCLGLILGGTIGLLVVIGLLLLIRPRTPPIAVSAETLPADVTIFLSERSLSRFASEALASPMVIDCEPGGQIKVTTRIRLRGLEPQVDLGLSLERQGPEVVSRLLWMQLGFVKLPASWLPPEVEQIGALPGQSINQQVPPQFSLTGLTTTPEGLNLQLNWTGN